EARPAAPGVVLVGGAEELQPAGAAEVGAVFLVVQEFPGEGPLGPALAQHVVALGREFLPPLLVTLLQLLHRFRSFTTAPTRAPSPRRVRALPAARLRAEAPPRLRADGEES